MRTWTEVIPRWKQVARWNVDRSKRVIPRWKELFDQGIGKDLGGGAEAISLEALPMLVEYEANDIRAEPP
jgi:hypothetical protein